MIESVAKNLWLLLTLVIPGLFTYGAWRVLLLLEPSERLDVSALNQIDGSAITSASVIIAVALLQQAIAIAIEALLTLLSKMRARKWPNLYTLFHERFTLAAAGKLDENATRIIGNFFLSINMSVGISLLLIYFTAYEGMKFNHWIPLGITVLLAATLITTAFRMLNAKWVVEKCRGTAPSSTRHNDGTSE